MVKQVLYKKSSPERELLHMFPAVTRSGVALFVGSLGPALAS